VVQLIEDAMHRERRPMKQVVNEALRRALRLTRARRKSYRVKPHLADLRPGFDPSRLNQLADELEDEAILAKIKRGA
jgi:hypothetical protein